VLTQVLLVTQGSVGLDHVGFELTHERPSFRRLGHVGHGSCPAAAKWAHWGPAQDPTSGAFDSLPA